MRMPGIVQWFRFEEYAEAERALETIRALGIRDLRTALSWADWERPRGKEWFDWLVAKFDAFGLAVSPALFYTPMRRARLWPGERKADAKTSYPPLRPRDYALFCRKMISLYGDRLEAHIQIWNEPNNHAYWNQDRDPDSRIFADMAGQAIRMIHACGKKAVLGGLVPPYTDWLARMRGFGALEEADGVGVHCFPGTWDKKLWEGWPAELAAVRRAVFPGQEVWITETGFSTVTLEQAHCPETRRRRELEQIRYFELVLEAPADRIYWYSAIDQCPAHPTDNYLNKGTPCDPRAYHFGLVSYEGERKPLFEHWRRRSARQRRDAA